MVERAPDHEAVLAVPTDGLHELVMAAMLDWIMADAFNHGVDELRWHGPPAFKAAFDLRRSWTRPSGQGKRGMVVIAGAPPRLAGDRVYWVHRGRGAPRDREGWVLVSRERFLGLGARAAGLPIRIAYRFRRPDAVDRAMAILRARLAPRAGWAKYTLEIWAAGR